MKLWKKYKEENIIVGEDIPIQHGDNLDNMKIEKYDEVNDNVNEEEIIEDYEQGMIDAYVTVKVD